MPILGDFAAKYGPRAKELGVPADDLYQALIDTAENTVRQTPRFNLPVPQMRCSSPQTGTEVIPIS